MAQAAKDLHIRKLAGKIKIGNTPETRDDLVGNDDQDNEELIENEYDERSFLDTADEIINLDIPVSDDLGSGKQLYKCGASYETMVNLTYCIQTKKRLLNIFAYWPFCREVKMYSYISGENLSFRVYCIQIPVDL